MHFITLMEKINGYKKNKLYKLYKNKKGCDSVMIKKMREQQGLFPRAMSQVAALAQIFDFEIYKMQ